MTKHILTSDKFEGNITYGYNDAGYLCHFEVNAPILTEQQWTFLLQSLGEALTESMFQAWTVKWRFKTAVLEEDLSFDRFWNVYALKRNKIDAEKLWNGLDKNDRQLVLQNVKAYNRYCSRNASWYNKLYPDTYLRKHWKDEWDKA